MQNLSKEAAKEKIAELVVRFGEQLSSYKSAEYNETLTRRDFIDPFFKALGWDIDNESGYAEAYREVIHEDRVKIGKATKAPDYSFRLPGGKRLFFVEAKKPSVHVKDDIQPAYQVRRYGWSAKLPISIITDFEEFSVYDCTKKPTQTDKASNGRIKYLTYDNYISEFDYLWDTFSKERVLKGSFDRYIASDTHKRGTTTVDKEFLESIDKWREILAIDICKHNESLDEEELNFAVTQMIDRLIFLRIAEDRGVELYGRLKECLKGPSFYTNLFNVFRSADDKYNSGLFDFAKDKLSKSLSIDNKTIKKVVSELYFPESPYEFSVLSVEILGSAYEQFLGKQIKIGKGHKVVIEEKAEVRKAGGVYYTPEEIVDYIVDKTLSPIFENITVKAAEIVKIIDPACGSGSFLLGAYKYLLNWHKDKYLESKVPSKGGKASPLTPDGLLTTAEKKRILLNNIFGVDIDNNAVEVTKLSLLLKCMEGETEASINSQLKLFNDRILPTLDNNIKSGNSLVAPDFYGTQLDFGEDKKVKPFNWTKSFPDIFKKGGFDVVIGNPPYVQVTDDIFSEQVIEYYSKFKVAQYKVDLYHLFVEKGMSLLNKGGVLGFIIPSTWMTQQYTEKMRKHILSSYKIKEVNHLDYKVFDQADVYTEIILIENSCPSTNDIVQFYRNKISGLNNQLEYKAHQSVFSALPTAQIDIRTLGDAGKLFTKISKSFPRLDEVARASLGCQAYNSSKHTKQQILNRVFHSESKLSDEYMEELAGSDVSRYEINRRKGTWIKYGPWLHDYRSMDWLTGPRLLLREITGKAPYKIQAAFTDRAYCNYKTILNVSLTDKTTFSMKFLCGLLNSKLLSFLFSYSSNKIEANSFPRMSVGDLKKLPIAVPDFSNKRDKDIHDQVSKLVDAITLLKESKLTANVPSKLDDIEARLLAFQDKIDSLIFELYKLSENERVLVENDEAMI